jgi:hypothetical protein
MPQTFDAVHSRIREILLSDWDPSNAGRSAAAGGEYDSYVDPLYDLISSGADEQAVIDFLVAREREIMCFPGLDQRRLQPVARKLLTLSKDIKAE